MLGSPADYLPSDRCEWLFLTTIYSFVGRLSGAVEAAATRAHQVVAGCLQRVGTKDEGPLPHTEPSRSANCDAVVSLTVVKC